MSCYMGHFSKSGYFFSRFSSKTNSVTPIFFFTFLNDCTKNLQNIHVLEEFRANVLTYNQKLSRYITFFFFLSNSFFLPLFLAFFFLSSLLSFFNFLRHSTFRIHSVVRGPLPTERRERTVISFDWCSCSFQEVFPQIMVCWCIYNGSNLQAFFNSM